MSGRLSISIALCTYNGEKYLQEQLDSFLQQTRLPDELVVCDDGSQDATVAILQDFAARAPFPVRLSINPENLGFSKNFERAISLCEGDIIAISDQDDEWLPEKLAKFENVFLNHPEIGFVFCDAMLVDENLNPLGYSVWDYYGFKSNIVKYFLPGEFTTILFKRSAIAGAMTAFRAVLREIILPSANNWAYDQWIPFAASIHMGVASLPEKLNKYRQHEGQCCGVKLFGTFASYNLSLKLTREYYADQAKKWSEALSRLSSNQAGCVNKQILKAIEEKIYHLRTRSQMPNRRLKRLPIIFREFYTGRYVRCSSGWKSIVRDLTWHLE
jgi:glycosyltransferase involved in cell wall biosynthesis